MSRSVREFLPLKPIDFLVLLALLHEDRHGYGIVRDIATETNGRIRLVPGNLYTILRRLLADGLIAESKRRPLPGREDVRRRYYRLSDLGATVLRAESRRLRDLVATVEERGLLEPGEA